MTTGDNSEDKGKIVILYIFYLLPSHSTRFCAQNGYVYVRIEIALAGMTALRDKQMTNRCKAFKVKQQSFKCDSTLVLCEVSNYSQRTQPLPS